MSYLAKIQVTLRKSILDTQGKTVSQALSQLGYSSIGSVRIGKYIEVEIAETSASKAKEVAEEACKKLLSNPVMEDYHIDLIEIAAK
ncbi:MAG: phosphoribosylformylglycinamidine synthase subunit PurS [Chloroherpetonaceae bacterium]|nr:phosphoribosylformylglycinamidine synthase subunit PurS [Chloroherpetonaceae bacterium]